MERNKVLRSVTRSRKLIKKPIRLFFNIRKVSKIRKGFYNSLPKDLVKELLPLTKETDLSGRISYLSSLKKAL